MTYENTLMVSFRHKEAIERECLSFSYLLYINLSVLQARVKVVIGLYEVETYIESMSVSL